MADRKIQILQSRAMTAIDEASVAVEAVKSVSGLPVFVSLSYDKAGEDFRTMMGVSPEQAVSQIGPLGIDGIGFNCGTASLEDYVKLAERFADAVAGADLVLLGEPNAGIPELVGDETVYNVTASDYAAAVSKIADLGFGILGGCCGSNPEFIKAVSEKLNA